MALTGGCLCGALRYEASGEPYSRTVCHCTLCRRAAGAPAVAWFSVKRGEFQLAGIPARFRSSPAATRSFCPACGTQIAFEADDTPDEIDITIASLDDPNALPPIRHIWTESRLAWVLPDGLPEHPRDRSS